MTITRTERDWLNALWAQAERDVHSEIFRALMAMNQYEQKSPFPLPRWEP